MKLHFLGANRQVTGSKYCLEVNGSRILVDCGMFQERAFQHRNWENFPIDASSIDLVVLTHAHIDHSGLLPRLVRQGFQGTIYATEPTVDLADVMLRDAAHIQMEDIKYKQKRHKKQGKKSPYPYEPLYDDRDAISTLRMLYGVPYSQTTQVNDSTQLTFHEAGHILGSSSLQFSIQTESGATRQVIFSGDIGQWDKPLIRDPAPVDRADYLVMESTYGNRNHRDGGDIEAQLLQVIAQTFQRGGKLVIPTFAVERAQELIYYIGRLVHDQKIRDIPIFLDSPMAIDVTSIFHRHRDSYDAQTWQLITAGVPPLRFPGLQMCRTTEQSKAINGVSGSAIIMSTSGMCTAGRIKHHLKNHITDSRNTILFVGYQGQGTLGRVILDGKEEVRIHGRHYRVEAQIAQIYGFSGHADRDALLRWAASIQVPPQGVFLTHGEENSSRSLAAELRRRNWTVNVPDYLDTVELS